MPDLLEGIAYFGGGIVRDAPLHFLQDTRARGVQAKRDDARKTVPLAVAPVESRHLLEFFPGQPQKTETPLFARRVGGQRALLRLGAGEIGMRPHQREPRALL